MCSISLKILCTKLWQYLPRMQRMAVERIQRQVLRRQRQVRGWGVLTGGVGGRGRDALQYVAGGSADPQLDPRRRGPEHFQGFLVSNTRINAPAVGLGISY